MHLPVRTAKLTVQPYERQQRHRTSVTRVVCVPLLLLDIATVDPIARSLVKFQHHARSLIHSGRQRVVAPISHHTHDIENTCATYAHRLTNAGVRNTTKTGDSIRQSLVSRSYRLVFQQSTSRYSNMHASKQTNQYWHAQTNVQTPAACAATETRNTHTDTEQQVCIATFAFTASRKRFCMRDHAALSTCDKKMIDATVCMLIDCLAYIVQGRIAVRHRMVMSESTRPRRSRRR